MPYDAQANSAFNAQVHIHFWWHQRSLCFSCLPDQVAIICQSLSDVGHDRWLPDAELN